MPIGVRNFATCARSDCRSETFLVATLRAGGAGCISATANVNPAAIAKLGRDWQKPDSDAQQAALDAVRSAFQRFPMIPALKAAVAHFSGDNSWPTVRPPLVALSDNQKNELIALLNTLGFAMPGLAGEESRPVAQAPA